MQEKNNLVKVITYSNVFTTVYTVVYLIRYLLFQIQKRRSHFMVAKLSVIPAAIYVVGKEQSEIEFFCMISVLVSIIR